MTLKQGSLTVSAAENKLLKPRLDPQAIGDDKCQKHLTFDTCLRTILKDGFSIFQYAENPISGKIDKPVTLNCLGHSCRKKQTDLLVPTEITIPTPLGSLDLTHVAFPISVCKLDYP